MSVAVLPSPGLDRSTSKDAYPFVLEMDAASTEQTEVVDEVTEKEIVVEANVMDADQVMEVNKQWAAHGAVDVKEEQGGCFSADDEDDSDYLPEDDEDDEDDDVIDGLEPVEHELDHQVDEVRDVYLKEMLAKRDQLSGEDAEWVDKYIQAQEDWRQRHGSSIDEIDLDIWATKSSTVQCETQPTKEADLFLNPEEGEDAAREVFWRMWQGRVTPWLPGDWQRRRQDMLLSLLGAVVFVIIALGIQFHVLFHEVSPLR